MPKITLNQVGANSYFCSGALSIGVYTQGQSAILLDSGGDESCAKDVANAVQEAGLEIVAIINTHCHPDHCGGNAFFQKKFPNIKIYATHDEQRFIEDPLLAPRCFCGLAAPFADLQNKYLAPQKPCCVTDVIAPYQDQTITIHGADFKIVTLPGHTPGSIGIITPDNVFYAGDALFGQETFTKHAILFYTDIGKTLASFKKLATVQATSCVLYHGGIIDDLAAAAQQHEVRILQTKDAVLTLIQHQALSVDLLTQQIMQLHNIPNSIVSFTLTQTAMRAYLTQLEFEKAVELKVLDGLLQAVSTTQK